MSSTFKLGPESRALVIGASGGIGYALTMALGNICGMGNVVPKSRSADGVDIRDEQSIRDMVATLEGPFDLIIVATGALNAGNMEPEKTILSLTADAMRAQFDVNALGPALLIKHLHGLLATDRPALLAVLTARVGSIEDNRLGGWISYRTAKAAANQIIKTSSLEIQRKNKNAIVLALHPGTVLTDLSRKFAKPDNAVVPSEAATNLLAVLDGRKLEDNGQFYDWQGTRVDW